MPHRVFAEYPWLCCSAAAFSLLLTLWAWHVDPIINNDGTQYVRAATHFAAGEWQKGFDLYKWPFYSILSGIVARLSGVTPAQSAYGVNAVLYVLLIWGFLALLRVLGGDRRLLMLGAAVVLLHPSLNEYRSFIIRDVGFWALYVWSLAYLFDYLLSEKKRSLALWGVAMALAALFRVEGIAFLVLVPPCLLACRTTGAVRWTTMALAAGAGVALVASFVLWQHVLETPDEVMAVAARLQAGWANVGGEIHERLESLEREFPGHLSAVVPVVVFLSTVGWIVLVKAVRALSTMYTLVAGYSLAAGEPSGNPRLAVYWWILILINLGYLLGFTLINFFLTDRYPFALGLTLLAWVPFGLRRLWRERLAVGRGRLRRWLAPAMTVLIVWAGGNGLAIGTNKQYLEAAGVWLGSNMPPGSKLYSNERRVIYYAGADSAFRSGASYSWDEVLKQIWSGRWRLYDYLALEISHNDPDRVQYVEYKLNRAPIKVFENEDGDQVLIFRGRRPK